MSKVLVDRELLNSALKTIHGLAPGRFAVEQELRAAVTAQPAEAEGVGKWSELKKLAEKATPGPWWVDSHGHRVSTENGMQTVFIAADKMGPATRHPETGNLSHWPNDWDASYIVNASPDKILELIAALSAVTAERDRLAEQASKFRLVERAMEALGCDEREGGIVTAASLILISSAHRMNAKRGVIDQEGVTLDDDCIGDWRVTIERISPAMAAKEA